MEYRLLDKSEIAKLAPTLQQLGWAIAYPQTCQVLAAVENGEIVGFQMLQLLPHLEPLYLAPEYRGTGLADELAKRGMEIFQTAGASQVLAVAGNAHAERICRDVLGMKKIDGVIFKS